MTNQELYNRVKTHLLAQNDKALDHLAQCAYYAADGKKCAIGCLIPTDKYDPRFENKSLCSFGWGDDILAAAGLTSDQKYLAKRLQNIHDCVGVAQWPSTLRLLALEFNLQP